MNKLIILLARIMNTTKHTGTTDPFVGVIEQKRYRNAITANCFVSMLSATMFAKHLSRDRTSDETSTGDRGPPENNYMQNYREQIF